MLVLKCVDFFQVAASYDLNAFQYNMIWRLQAPRSDIILDLHQTMFEQLNFYFEKRNNYPEQIIIYREGVSEDNFINVSTSEILCHVTLRWDIHNNNILK